MASERDRLSEQVHLLGDLLGKTIVEQEGQPLFDLVEDVRGLAKAHRAGDEAAGERLLRRVESLPLAESRGVVKAFATYFQLVNLAEEQERVRVLRRREREAHAAGSSAIETIGAAVRELRESGVSAEEVQALLDRLLIMPVFTAHPTEAKRRTILTKLARIADVLHGLDLHSPTPEEERAAHEVLREEIVSLWQTDETRAYKPAVIDEVRNGLYYFESVTLRPGARDGGLAREGAGRALPRRRRPPRLSALRQLDRRRPRRQPVRHAGGDRGDAPRAEGRSRCGCCSGASIGCTATSAPPSGSACHAELADSIGRTPRSSRTRRSGPRSATPGSHTATSWFTSIGSWGPPWRPTAVPGAPITASAPAPMSARPRSPRGPAADPGSLAAHGAQRLADGRLATLIRQVEMFGFHLATLDIRQHASGTRPRWPRSLPATAWLDDYAAVSEERRSRLLTAELLSPRPLAPAPLDFSAATNETLELFRLIRHAHERVGPAGDRELCHQHDHPAQRRVGRPADGEETRVWPARWMSFPSSKQSPICTCAGDHGAALRQPGLRGASARGATATSRS